MFIPLHDGVPLRFMRAPYVTYALICVCVGLQSLLFLRGDPGGDIALLAGFGMIPSVLFGQAHLPPEIAQAPAWLTLFSNILLHAGFAHLVGNMLFSAGCVAYIGPFNTEYRQELTSEFSQGSPLLAICFIFCTL